jgi:hypothetical protein
LFAGMTNLSKTMMLKKCFSSVKNYSSSIDWKLLGFLILFMNVKISVKILAIVLIYLLQFDFKLGLKYKNPRLPLFYPIVIGIALVNYVLYSGYRTPNYNLVLLSGIGFWMFCLLAMHQVKLSVERNDIKIIHQTILLFFLLNAAVSLLLLLHIILETHAINPYRYQGQYQKYFMGTGDYIRGLTFDVSTTNSALNAFGLIYFLDKKNLPMLILCMVILLLTGSNATNVMVMGILALLFIFKSNRDQKSMMVICLMFAVVFMLKISPQNDYYLSYIYRKAFHLKPAVAKIAAAEPLRITSRPDSTLNPEEKKEKTAQLYLDSVWRVTLKEKPRAVKSAASNLKIVIPDADIHSAPYQHRDTVNTPLKRLLAFVDLHRADLPLSGKKEIFNAAPGKITAIRQTVSFLLKHPSKILTGTGLGNFSSKIAFKAAGAGIGGNYPAKYTYINNSFLINHLDLYLNFFSRDDALHSFLNSPNSVYDQLLSEYGLLGILALFVFYFGYFLSAYKELSYGLPLLLLMAGLFFMDYWFEQLSLVVFFELMMLLNRKEKQGS